jgi:hypothetical protein
MSVAKFAAHLVTRLGKDRIVLTGQSILAYTTYYQMAHDSLQTCLFLVHCRSRAGLFHDKAPALCTTDVTIALPNQERLWQAITARGLRTSRFATCPTHHLLDLFTYLAGDAHPATPFSKSVFAIDPVFPHDKSLVRYSAWAMELPFSLTSPADMLRRSLEFLKEKVLHSPFALNIKSRLQHLS